MKRSFGFYAAFFLAALTRRLLSYLMIVYGFQVLGGGNWSGLLYFCVFAPYLVLGLSAGVLVDRSSKRRSLILPLIGTTLLFVLIAAASSRDWFGFSGQQRWFLAAGTFLYGSIYAIIYPAFMATVPQYAERAAIGKATVTLNVLSTIGLAYAPLLVGFLRQWLDWTALFIALAISSALSLAFVAWSGVAAGATSAGGRSDWDRLNQLWAFSRSHRFLGHIWVFAAFFCFFIVGPLEVLLPNLLEKVFQLSPLAAGEFIGVGGTGLVAGSILALALVGRSGTKVWLTASAILASTLMIFTLHASLHLLGPLLFVSGMAGGAFSSLIIANAQGCAPDVLRGRVMGLFALIMGGVPSLGGLAAGLLAGRFGVPFSVVAMFGGAITVFLLAGLAWMNPKGAPAWARPSSTP